jgi:cellobiose phosphorylase
VQAQSPLEDSKLKTAALYLRNQFRNFKNAWLNKYQFNNYVKEDSPLRAELFNATQMEQHGSVLAKKHSLCTKDNSDQLLARLADNESVIIEACNQLTEAIKVGRQITPAAVWLLDNFYLIEEHIRTAKLHFPKNYSRELPKLLSSAFAGRPRVYDIVLEIIAHRDGRIDPESLNQFVTAYQEITTLKLGELWAIPIMLRLALIENLRRISARLIINRYNRNLADSWADTMAETAEKSPNKLILLVADMARSNPPMESSFVAELVRRLQDEGSALTLPLTWLSQRLLESGQTIDNIVLLESQRQAADQVSMSNSIGSLRLLGGIDWREFVEKMSVVDHVLSKDPCDVYRKMDFATRNHYRQVVEKIARHSKMTEVAVAENAIRLAAANKSDANKDNRTSHVGYYLIGNGLSKLKRAVKFRLPFFKALQTSTDKAPLCIYLGSIILSTLAVTGWIVIKALIGGTEGWLLAVIGITSLIATSQLAIAIINWLCTLSTEPCLLPRMDFSAGIPDESRTIVVVPSMLITKQNIDHLIEAIEIRFLANQDANLRFCLLTDFSDAQTETMPLDDDLLKYAQKNIVDLNLRYPHPSDDNFLLFHRQRRWNNQEKIWMGYERKRGKLADMNVFLLTGISTAFSLIVGNISGLVNVKYVISLDTDTELPRDAARKFVATMAHPLNRVKYDEKHKCVREGYGILQPRLAVSLPGDDASPYELLNSGDIGIDPYTRMVSDVYQDMFGEGSFIGKGIYDVEAFQYVLNGHMPENRILSHDLLEGCYIRSGLLSDVQLFEKYPSSYIADMKRRHRWIRGDWQIASWLFFKVPGMLDAVTNKHIRHSNPLSVLSRWKLLDNLRRSVVPFSLTTLVLAGWALTPSPWFWTCVALGIYYIPSLCAFLQKLTKKPEDVLFRQHISFLVKSTSRHFFQATLTLSFLPFEAWFNLDAILRTQWRLLISHQQLLEWNPSSEENLHTENGLYFYYRLMWIAPTISVVAAIYLGAHSLAALFAAAPILLLWWASPSIAWFISQPMERPASDLSSDQVLFLKSLSRKEWHFFETYVGPNDNWLPPDNVQENPSHVIAHRTSPTNIGLSLLSNLAAYDFGYLLAGKLIERSQHTLQTMGLLERYQGHFYNWYHTQELVPLLPNYVSTVDSGNLAGHLLTFQAGIKELADKPIFMSQVFNGIQDTYAILRNTAGASLLKNRLQFEEDLKSVCQLSSQSLANIYTYLERLTQGAQHFITHCDAIPSITIDPQLKIWAHALANQCNDALNEFNFLIPWAQMLIDKEWMANVPQLREIPTLNQLAQLHANLKKQDLNKELDSIVAMSSLRASERMLVLDQLVVQSNNFAQMEYDFLYNPITHLLAIGYNVTEHRRDNSYYDLLASEARLAVFVGIAQDKIPQKSWFALGRQLTTAGSDPILLSWSGSMFEYLMPLLIMPAFKKTLLDQTYQSAVDRQIQYGQQRGVPWGISESGYNNFDTSLNYQYRAFGVPGLGFKRGLGDDLVIAPYASMMALMVVPEQACNNLQQLSLQGYVGQFGFYEAIDFTTSRLPRGKSSVVIRSFMAHHQGMGFLSLAYLLLDRPMQKRFESIPMFQAIMPLLHERVPKPTAAYANTTELADIRTEPIEQEMQMRVIRRSDSRTPEVQLLSNGRYHVMITSGGGSCSRWNDLSLTRWREDATRDNWGMFCYIRDLEDGHFWSTGFQPTAIPSTNYEVIFSEGRAEFRRSDHNVDMHTEIVVSPEDDVELRRTTIVNRSSSRRTIEITSYAEVVLAPGVSDAIHPAFSNLFIQTEIIDTHRAIVCTRRPRSVDEKNPWMFHQMVVHDANISTVSYETSRMEFIGRCNSTVAPQVMLNKAPLAGNQGAVLDPIIAIRYQITLEAEQTATIDLVLGITETRDHCLELIEKYQDRQLANRVIELAWTHSQVTLQQLNASAADAQLFNKLASSVVYVNPLLRADSSVLIRNQRGQSGLWSYTISGDLPIVLVQIKSQENIELVHQLIRAHAYWSSRGLAVDLVIWNEDHAGYRQVLQEQILGLISSVTGRSSTDHPGGIFVRLADQITIEDRVLFHSVARIILNDSRGTLAEQILRRDPIEIRVPKLIPTRFPSSPTNRHTKPHPTSTLILSNDLGGFTEDGREYVITTSVNHVTPAPWANVIANANFGSVISESGQAYTWGENAHEFRLTPWANDPVCDPGGEVFYLRDEETGHYWSPTPLPCRGEGQYITRHGFGYSVFEHTENGVNSELTVYVAVDASVKYSVLQLHNTSDTLCKLSITGYVEWVLGDLRPKSAMHIVTEIDQVTGAILARNPYNTEFTNRVAFFDAVASSRTISGDRNEFIGRNGSLQRPAAMERKRLSGKIGAGLDPCAALQIPFELNPGEQRQFVFVLGMADTHVTSVTDLVKDHSSHAAASAALTAVHAYWKSTLGAIQVSTPDPSLNILANGWLMYQTISCRLWARSGYYQSSGAFGFRDQLQDCMALVHNQPHLLRAHLLLCAAHQFIEGDVLHWWHPPTDRGVRTHCSDDFLWLPMAVHRYVKSTSDTSILDEVIHFIEGRQVNPNEDSYYDLPNRSQQAATLYEHCVRAIEHGLKFGVHGLSLMGSCDWNDAMNKVGEQGKGESIWLSFFFHEVLIYFADIAITHNDLPFSERCRTEAGLLRQSINKNGWDGEWYLRAYFDDGTPLGSAQNQEGQIDSISQSWSVLSGAGELARSQMAMQAVERRLVRRKDAIIQLLDPPFDKSDQDPGYIRGYVPGVRENGGQYTHAAIWAAMAFAKMGNHERAWELMQIINPINHGDTAKKIATYKIEPYVIAADVYAVVPHIGRGGWSWYTGSAGWMYRLLSESLLGIHLEGNQLTITPCLPADWGTYEMQYRYQTTMYRITVTQRNPEESVANVKVDGIEQVDGIIRLVNDQLDHSVEIVVHRRISMLLET